MKYSLTRKINLKRFFPDLQYEMVDFHVEDCDTKEQATEEINIWIKEYLKEKEKEYKELQNRKLETRDPVKEFEDSLN